MATTTEELVARIEIQTGNSNQEVKNLTKNINDLDKSMDKAGKSTGPMNANLLKLGASAFAAYQAITKMVDVVSGGVQAFLHASDAVSKMNQALELSGNVNAKEATRSFVALGDSIEAMGIASTESVLKLAKIGTAAGQATKDTERLIKVATDLSVAREIPLEAAFKALSATLKGSAGQLSAFIPELKDLTEEQLKAGKAIEYVSLQVGGFAARNLETYEGKWALLKTRFEDVSEAIGGIIVDIFSIGNAMDSSTSSLDRATQSLIANKDNIVALGKTILSGLVYVFETLINVVKVFGSVFQTVFGAVTKKFGEVAKYIHDLLGISNVFNQKIVDLGQSFLDAGKANRDAANEWAEGIEEISDTTKDARQNTVEFFKRAQDAKKALAEIRLNTKTQEQLAEGKKLLDELVKKVTELGKANALAGKEGEAAIIAKYEADRKEINAIKEKLEFLDKYHAEEKKTVKKATDLINEAQALEIAKFRLDTLKDINQQNDDIAKNIQLINATQLEAIDYELEARLKVLDIRRKQISLDDKASQDAIDTQEKLLRIEAKRKGEKAETTLGEDWEQAGQDLGAAFKSSNIEEVFKNSGEALKSAGKAVGGTIMAAAGYIGMAIDAVMNAPKYLQALIDFPKNFLAALQSIPGLIEKFVATFPEGIRKIAEALPSILVRIVDLIPDFMAAFLDAMPTVIERLAEVLPTILIKLIGMLPKFFEIMFKGVAKMIQGFIKGLIRGIGNILSGRLPKIQVDTAPLKKAASNFVGSASRVFKVGDITENVKDNLKNVTDSIKDAFNTGASKTRSAWDWVVKNVLDLLNFFIVKPFMWVWDNVIMPIFNIVQKAFLWVWDNVLKPIVNLVSGAFQWVIDNVINPLVNGISAVFQWVIDNVINPLVNGISAVFQWVIDNVINPLIEGITAAWQWVYDNLIKPFMDAFVAMWEGIISAITTVFQWVYDNIFKPIIDAYVTVFNWVNDNIFKPIINSFSVVFQWVYDSIFKPIIDAYVTVFNWVNDHIFRPIIDSFTTVFDTIYKNVFEPIIDAFSSIKIETPEWLDDLIKATGGGGGGGGPTIGGDVGKAANKVKKALGLAGGGMIYAQDGLFVPRGTDTVPAMLTPGEFVINRTAVQDVGSGLLHQINRGQMPNTGSTTVNIEVNLDAKVAMDEGYIRGTLIPKMTEELKRASLNGNFVISSRGIR